MSDLPEAVERESGENICRVEEEEHCERAVLCEGVACQETAQSPEGFLTCCYTRICVLF